MTRQPHHDIESSLMILGAIAILALLFWAALQVQFDAPMLVTTI